MGLNKGDTRSLDSSSHGFWKGWVGSRSQIRGLRALGSSDLTIFVGGSCLQ